MEIDEESSTLIFDFEKVLDNEAVAKARGDNNNNNNNSSRSGNNPRDSSRSVVCKHWLRGLCKKGDYCEFLHEYDLSKMPECYFFSRFGECSNPECQYLHIKPEERIRECPWYNRGFCKHGPRCRHKHVKRIACANYLAGFCPDGPKCDYGHAKYELRLDGFDEAGGGKPRTGGSTRLTCHACGLSGHRAAVCPNNPGGDNVAGFRSLESVTCYKCSRRGHYANACPRAGAAGYVAAS